MHLNGLRIFVNPALPYDETLEACDIETRRVIHIRTGKKIHMLKVDEKLFVSQIVYGRIKSNNNPLA